MAADGQDHAAFDADELFAQPCRLHGILVVDLYPALVLDVIPPRGGGVGGAAAGDHALIVSSARDRQSSTAVRTNIVSASSG